MASVDVRTAVAAPRWFVEPPDHFLPPTDVRLEPRHAPGIAPALAGTRPRLVATRPFDPDLGHEHAIELVDGGPAAVDGSLAAATDPRSAGAARRLVTGGAYAILGRPVAGCAHTRPPPVSTARERTSGGARDLERQPELPVLERVRGRPRRDRGPPRRCARQPWPGRSPRSPRRSTRTSAGGSGSAPRRAARASSTPRATRSRSTRSTSCATGPARRRSCAERDRPEPPTERLTQRLDPEVAASRRRLMTEALGIAVSAIGLRLRLRPVRPRRRLLARRGDGDEHDRLRGRGPVRGRRLRGERPRLARDRAPDRPAQRAPPALLRGAWARGCGASRSAGER